MRNKNHPRTGTKINPIERRHHWLVSAVVLFRESDKPDGVGRMDMNTVITNEGLFVTANMIGEAQQIMQMQVFDRIKDPTIQMINVSLTSIDYLGEMSKEEFYTPPPTETAADTNLGSAVSDPNDPFSQDTTSLVDG